MDSVSTTGAGTTPTAASSGSTQATSSKDMLSSDFETFLTMLTVQLENQDPLNPMDSQEFAVQLATFSGVEQQVRSNDLLESINENLGGSGLAQYGGWVGMEGRAAVATLFDGSAVTVMPEIDPEADSAQLVVRDENKTEVRRLAIGIDGEPVTWDGTDESGETVAAGSYDFIVKNSAGGAEISETKAEVFAPITEVRNSADGIRIVFASGDEAAASQVAALRQP